MPVHYHHIIPSPHLWHPLTSKAGPWAGAGALLKAIKSRCFFSWVSRDSSSSRSLSFRSLSKRWLMVSTPLDLKTLDGVQGIADRVSQIRGNGRASFTNETTSITCHQCVGILDLRFLANFWRCHQCWLHT